MDFVNKLTGSDDKDKAKKPQEGHSEGGGLMGKLNNAMGGGQSGEKKEG